LAICISNTSIYAEIFPIFTGVSLSTYFDSTFGMQGDLDICFSVVGMRILRRNIGHRGAGYVLALTFVVLFAGAAGMLHLEGSVQDSLGIIHI